jgi:hypothetical protein
MHDPQVAAAKGPEGMVAAVKVYQDGVDGHWGIEDIFSSGEPLGFLQQLGVVPAAG